jgi:hypothetical protein
MVLRSYIGHEIGKDIASVLICFTSTSLNVDMAVEQLQPFTIIRAIAV